MFNLIEEVRSISLCFFIENDDHTRVVLLLLCLPAVVPFWLALEHKKWLAL
jgi:hypothetical protein